MYVYVSLGDGFLPQGHCFEQVIQRIRQEASRCLMRNWSQFQLTGVLRKRQEMLEDQMTEMLLEGRERQLAAHLFQQSSLRVFIGKLVEADPDLVRQKLGDNDPLVRLIAVLTAGKRHLHLEKELIEHLNDPHPLVRKAARLALVRATRGTDFGPIPGASQKGIARSVEKWQHWLALQHGESADTLAKSGTVAVKSGKFDPDKAIHLVLDHGNQRLQTLPPEVTTLRDELLKAKGEEQMSLLARLRDAKGIDNTDALALAIPKMAGAIQRETRDALAQRLTRMKATTLRDKMQDDSVEVRRAAASACGHKKATEHIPDLLQLLDDPEVAVIQAARRALKELTAEDFGPDEAAGRRGRIAAAAAWRHWWQQHHDSQK